MISNKLFHFLLSAVVLSSTACAQNNQETKEIGLKDAYGDIWRTSVSVNQWEVAPSTGESKHNITGYTGRDQTEDYAVIAKHFDWVVAENCMKMEQVHPADGVYDFTLADQFVNKALENGQQPIGHCLIWHSQCPEWFFLDSEGKTVAPEVLRERMREHIFVILNHFRGRVKGWDVVNEAFEDDGSLRRSKFYEILGEEFIPLAFNLAHEADSTIELYYNDYSMNKASKVQGVVKFFKPLVADGMPLTAVGFQGHLILGDADYVKQYQNAIRLVRRELNVPSQFTELDLSILPNPYSHSGANVASRFEYSPQMDPYKNGVPDDVLRKAESFWLSFYTMLLNNKRDVLRVGFWCLNDGNSWRNDYPIRGRTDYATLFNRDNTPKPVVDKLIKLVNNNKQ